MRRTTLLSKFAILSCSFLISTSAFAQGDVSGLIKSGPADATKLAQAYLNPFFKGLGIGLNSGWNNTAHAKNPARFELRFGVTGAFVPSSDKMFDVTKIGLSNTIRPVSASDVMSPTVASGKSNGPVMAIYDNSGREVERFTMPQGASLSIIPAPQLQGTIGLPKGIDVTLRAMPKVNLGQDIGTLSMLGGGIKVELLPLLLPKMVDKVVPVDVALAVGYTQINYKLPLDVKPDNNSIPKDAQQSQDFSNQMVDAQFSGINAEAIVSKKLLFFTPFLSLGYNSSKTDAGMKGNYPFVTGATLLGQKTYTSFNNPISIKQTDVSGFRSNVGFQLNLAILRVYSSYSMGEYNSFNFGLGLGLGK